MPRYRKIYRKRIWHVLPEWHGLNFDSALLTEIYWNYATHIVRVCVSSISPINPNLHDNKKSNLQVHLCSKAMASFMNFFATTLLHVLIPCLKKCSPISRLEILHTSSIIKLMKTLIINQFISLNHLFLRFNLMIRPTFPR